MTTETKEKLAFRVKKMKTSYGVSYSHLARLLGVANTTMLAFANGRTECFGDEKCEFLWKLTEPFFPEPRKKEQVADNEEDRS